MSTAATTKSQTIGSGLATRLKVTLVQTTTALQCGRVLQMLSGVGQLVLLAPLPMPLRRKATKKVLLFAIEMTRIYLRGYGPVDKTPASFLVLALKQLFVCGND